MEQNCEKQLKLGDKVKLLLDYEIPTNYTCIAGRKLEHKQAQFNCELIDESVGLGNVKMFYVKVVNENSPYIKKEFWAPADMVLKRIAR